MSSPGPDVKIKVDLEELSKSFKVSHEMLRDAVAQELKAETERVFREVGKAVRAAGVSAEEAKRSFDAAFVHTPTLRGEPVSPDNAEWRKHMEPRGAMYVPPSTIDEYRRTRDQGSTTKQREHQEELLRRLRDLAEPVQMSCVMCGKEYPRLPRGLNLEHRVFGVTPTTCVCLEHMPDAIAPETAAPETVPVPKRAIALGGLA